MPTFGSKKTKDMVRSVLPSTARKGSKDRKDGIHRNHRRIERQAVKQIARDPDAFDEFTPDDKGYDHEISYAVRERRNHDKVKPIMKWAQANTKGKHDKRIAQMRKVLPKGTIGDHAITHLEGLKEFQNPDRAPYGENYTYVDRRSHAEKERSRRQSYEFRREWLLKMFIERPWLHGHLNNMLKNEHQVKRHSDYFVRRVPANLAGDAARFESHTGNSITIGARTARTLQSRKDVDNFLSDLSNGVEWPEPPIMTTSQYGNGKRKPYPLYGARDVHPEWRHTLDRFIEENGDDD